jgi:transposase
VERKRPQRGLELALGSISKLAEVAMRSPASLHLEEIATAVAPGAHAILVLDQAGSHVSKTLPVPPNITLVPLPAKSPELNPVENIWQFMRDNWLSNRVFRSYEDILDHCCFAGTS